MLSRAHGRHGGVSFERQGHIGFQPWCSRKGGNYRLSTMNILKKPGSTRLLAIFVVYLAQSLIPVSRKLPVHDENDGMRLAPRFFPILDRISCLETHGGRCLDATCASPNDNYKFQCIQSTSEIKVGIGQIPRHQIPIPKPKTQTWNSALGYAAEKQIPRPQIPRPKVQLGI